MSVTMLRPRETLLGRLRTSIRGYMMRGLLVLVPLGVTVYVLGLCYRLTAGRLAPFIARHAVDLPPVAVALLAVVLFFAILYLAGLATAFVIGRRIISLAETVLSHIPLVHTVYAAAKQLVGIILLHNEHPSYEAAVLVGFPSRATKAMGFITGAIEIDGAGELQKVLVPTAPAPTCGYLLMVPREDLQRTNLSVDDALQSLLSVGIVMPATIELAAKATPPTATRSLEGANPAGKARTARRSILGRLSHALRTRLLSGFFALVPIATTAFVIDLLYEHTVGRIAPLTLWLLGPLPRSVVVMVSIALVLAALYVAGQVATILLGASLIRLGERVLSRIPLVTTVYGATKQIVDRLVREDHPPAFEEAVVVEFPYPDAKTIGFVVGRVRTGDDTDLVKVLIPRIPDITIGLLIFVKPDQVFSCGLSIEEAVKMVVSGGIIGPATLVLAHWEPKPEL